MIIIIGASRGIGNFLFNNLSEKSKVIGTYNATCNLSTKNMYPLDVTNYASIEHFQKAINNQIEGLVLINCAGVSYSSFAHKSDPEEWRKVIDVNLVGTYNLIRVFLPIMRELNYGRIINFSSVVAQRPTLGTSAYAASKAALWGLAKSIAAENASKNITINNINLGYADIGMGMNEISTMFMKEIIKDIPAQRFCKPQEILQCVNLLINNEYINGSSIDLNGGLI